MGEQVEVLLKNNTHLGEGPFWDERTESLHYVDLFKGDVCRYDSRSGEASRLHVSDGTTSLIIPREKGGFVITRQTDVAILESWESGSVKNITRIYGDQDMMLNDGKVDSSGRLWFGSCFCDRNNTDASKWPKERGSLYSLGNDGVARRHVGHITISNGMDWSLDNRTMYYIDSVPRKVYAFDFNLDDCTISNQKILADFSGSDISDRGYPDGMAVDEEGKLWIACSQASRVVRVDGETGQVIRSVKLPTAFITSCCFGGKDYSDLFVTTGTTSEPLSGSLFKVSGLGPKGRKQNFFNY